MAEIVLTWRKDPALLTETEAYRFRLYVLSVLRQNENAFQQHRLGTLDSDLWRGYLTVLESGFVQHQGFEELWASLEGSFSQAFQDMMAQEFGL